MSDINDEQMVKAFMMSIIYAGLISRDKIPDSVGNGEKVLKSIKADAELILKLSQDEN